MTLTGIAGFALGVRVGDQHRKRLEKALAAKDDMVKELNKKIKEKEKIVAEARRDSRETASKSGSSGGGTRKTTTPSQNSSREPQRKKATKASKDTVSEPSTVYPEQDPGKLLASS
jgi:hypothetical protein